MGSMQIIALISADFWKYRDVLTGIEVKTTFWSKKSKGRSKKVIFNLWFHGHLKFYILVAFLF